jgi:hypothetical protein
MLRFGLRGTRRILRIAAATEGGGAQDTSMLQTLGAALRRVGDEGGASRLLGILASPELDD